MTVYDDMRGYIHAHDRNGWFDVATETTPMYQMVDKADAENAKLRELVRIAGTYCVNGLCGKDDGCPLYLGKPYCALPDRMRELRVEVDG